MRLRRGFRLSVVLNFLLLGDCLTLSHELLCKTRKPVTLKVSLIMTWNILDSLKSRSPPPPSFLRHFIDLSF